MIVRPRPPIMPPDAAAGAPTALLSGLRTAGGGARDAGAERCAGAPEGEEEERQRGGGVCGVCACFLTRKTVALVSARNARAGDDEREDERGMFVFESGKKCGDASKSNEARM